MRRSAILAVGVIFLAIGIVEAVVGSKKATPASSSFQPWAASFVSASTGFVLGGLGCRYARNVTVPRCAAVLEATSDGGATWRRLAEPGPLLEPFHHYAPGAQNVNVSAITFADARNGWLYDAGLWSTHDGGGHWSRLALRSMVTSVVASSGWAYAAVSSSSAAAPVLRTPVDRDDWQPVPSLPKIATPGIPSLLAASGSTALAALQSGPAPALWRTVGPAWQRIPSLCSNPFDALDASSPDDLIALCAQPVIAISTDAGAHARRTALPNGLFAIGPIGVPTGQAKVIVLASPGIGYALSLPLGVKPISGATYRTTDGGHSWTRTVYADRGAGFADLQFVSPTVGWVVHGYPGAATDQLLHTTDAGATFTPVAF